LYQQKKSEIMFTVEELKAKAPAVFRTAEEGAKAGASKHYQFIPTIDVIDDLSKFGWNIHDVGQQKSKTSPDTTRHLVRFRHQDFGAVGVGGNIPEILFTNSHDRTRSMNFHVGLFRLICSNGLVVADATFGKLNLRHMGYSFENVREMIGDITEKLPVVFDTIKTFERTEMSEEARKDFAMKAFAIRYPEYINEKNVADLAQIALSVDVNGLLVPQRADDAPNNLWTVFNRVQEKLVNGQFKHLGSDNKVRQARPIKNITLNLDINEGLWQLANSYAQ
jgi:hypothetical protein